MNLDSYNEGNAISAPPTSTLQFSDRRLSTRNARGAARSVRHRNGQQEINRHAERLRDFLMQRHRPFALTRLQLGEIALSYSDRRDQLDLRRAAPLAQDANRILSGREPVDDRLGQHDLAPGRDGVTCLLHKPCGANLLVGSLLCEPLILALRKNCEFHSVRNLDELDLRHDGLLIVNFASMPHRDNNDRITLLVKDDAPVSNSQPRAGTSFETFDVALTCSREGHKFGIESPTHIGREIEPLACCCGRKRNLHRAYIAKSNICVKWGITLSDNRCHA